MYEHVKTGYKHIPPSEQPLQFQSGYYLNKPRKQTNFIHKPGTGAKCAQSFCYNAEILRNINQLELLLLFYFTFVMNRLLTY